MNSAARLSARLAVVLVLASVLINVHAQSTYTIDVILPLTGGAAQDNARFNNASQAALLAAADVTNAWTSSGDTLTVNVIDSASNGATAMKKVLDSANGGSVAVVGVGDYYLTQAAAQLLNSFNVRPSLASTHFQLVSCLLLPDSRCERA